MNNSGLAQRLIPVAIGLIGVLFFAAKGCEEGPFGRKQIVGMNPQEELKLGIQAYKEILSKSDIDRDPRINAAINEVGRRLARAAENSELRKTFGVSKDQVFEWEFKVVDDKQVNAFCLPGGKVVVYTGILPICETDTGLAVVMGHEIGHALARHGAERMAQTRMAQFGQIAVAGGLASPDMSPRQRAMVMGAISAGTQLGLLSYSRKHESEADHIGIMLMAQAGYNPREAPKFWVRMNKAAGSSGRPPEFMSTHPNPETRVRDLEKWLEADALRLYNASPDKSEAKPLPSAGQGRFPSFR